MPEDTPPHDLVLVLGSNNRAKLAEIRQALELLPVEVMSFAEAGGAGDLPEPGETFAENAAAKALEAARRTGRLALADDSGLEVEALGGRPGVRSARYGGPGLTDAERCLLLLEEGAGVQEEERGAEFVCVLALATAERVLATWEGRAGGTITEQMRGESGFGYDPIFLYPPAGKTFAEMTSEEKNAVSHRGRAVRQLPDHLRRLGLIQT